jgi:transcriptional regulator with XRE-family HTH domain
MTSQRQRPAGPFADRLRKAREKADLRLDDASVFLRQTIGSEGPSRETIRRYEMGLVPEGDIPAIILAGMATVYGVDLKALSPLAAERLESQWSLIDFRPAKARKPRSDTRTNIRRSLALA